MENLHVFIFFCVLFRIPNDPNIRERWISEISKHQQFSFYLVCDLHFHTQDLKKNGTLKKGSVPTIFERYIFFHNLLGEAGEAR